MSNLYILELRNRNTSFTLANILKDNCIQIENQLLKFNYHRERRAIDILGSAIRFVTGNLDQSDLKEINHNINTLFSNQEKLIKQISKYSSFANHITDRYVTDLNIIKQNINTSFVALSKINDRLNEELLIQYNIYLSQKLLDIIFRIQRLISLAFNNITDLEIISTEELTEIISHLKLIYKSEELLELDSTHLLKAVEFSKLKVASINNIIACILYIPILNPSPFVYQKIYPIPDDQNKILVPPTKYRLFGVHREFWTDEQCSVIENQILCLQKPQEHNCLLSEQNCQAVLVKNDYKLFNQLNNNKILVSCKNKIIIVEQCKGQLNHYVIVKNALVSSENDNNCKIIINNVTFKNTFSNFSYQVSKLPKSNFVFSNKYIDLEQKHFDEFSKLKEESKDLNSNINLNPIVHVAHISVTTILFILVCVVGALMYLFRNKIKQILFNNKQENCQQKEIVIQFKDRLYPDIPMAPQDEDALS